MSAKKYLFIWIIIGIIAWSLWALVVTFVDPQTSSNIAITLFYITLILAFWSSFTILGYWIRILTSRRELSRQRLNIAMRQGLFFSLLINFSLLLRAIDKFSWLAILVALLILSLIEFFFLSITSNNSSISNNDE